MKKSLILLVLLLTISCITKEDIDIRDYPIVTTINELSKYYKFNIDSSGKYEASTINYYFDGSTELNYYYDSTESDEYDPIFYDITINSERNLAEAILNYNIYKNALILGLKIGGEIEIAEIDSLQIPGDISYHALVKIEGTPSMTLFMVRKDKIIYSMMSTIITDDNSLIKDLIIPKITHLDEFKLLQ